MEPFSIPSRVAGLQVPISQIQTLAAAALQMIDELFPNEDQEILKIGNHLVNFVNLIETVAKRVGAETEAIEIAAWKQAGAR